MLSWLFCYKLRKYSIDFKYIDKILTQCGVLPIGTRLFKLINILETELNIILKLRVVIRYSEIDLYVKINKAEGCLSLKKEYENILVLRKIFKGVQDKFDCVEPVLFYSEENRPALVLKECDGVSLIDVIKKRKKGEGGVRNNNNAFEALLSIGSLIRYLEHNTSDIEKDPQDIFDAMVRESIKAEENVVLLIKLRYLADPLKLLINHYKAVINDASSDAATCPVYIAHGDMNLSNLYLSMQKRRRVTLLDPNLLQPRFINYDAVSFIHYLTLNPYIKNNCGQKVLLQMIAKFYEGYGRQLNFHSKTVLAIKALCAIRYLNYICGIISNNNLLKSLYFQIIILKMAETCKLDVSSANLDIGSLGFD